MDRPSTVDSHNVVGEPQAQSSVVIAVADDADRETIYQIRHQIYAVELSQHQRNQSARLTDPLDTYNVYLKAVSEGWIVGFVSITPPGHSYSVDKYFAREDFPFPFDDALYEIRLLTVLPSHRFRAVASLLMYAALRWIETRGGTRVVAIGRLEVLSLYEKAGLRSLDRRAKSGAVTYELLTATVPELRQVVERHQRDLRWLERRSDWRLNVPFRAPTSCSHGGAFFAAIGEDFRNLERSHDIINADVLDAWFPPSPRVIAAITEHLPWLLRTSPPTTCGGLVQVIANTRNVPPESIVPAAGSSELIYLALREWLTPHSRIFLLDPSYGEYSHVAEHIVGSRVDRLSLRREEGYTLNLSNFAAQAASGDYDLVVLVNPNSPTGAHIPRRELEEVLASFPANTRIWIDETYVEYAGPGESLESFAANSHNVVVCKSMSKVYALSGVRVAYLCGPAPLAEHLRGITPPWAVSLPAQVAAVNALEDSDYYAARYLETHRLREGLASDLRRQGLEVFPSTTNFLLCDLPARSLDARLVSQRCRTRGLYLRAGSEISGVLGDRCVRIAVKDASTNRKIAQILKWAMPVED
jgi:histidinol-phosphate/aromatic aminotransferase/cobyric acid decarboxylase-like protein/GNAT superfamily N-acetyltransferase